MDKEDEKKALLKLTAQEQKLIQLIRSMSDGELRVFIKDKQLVKADKVIRRMEL